ncbi:PaaI family thioesterase [Helicobacter bizzozeronii]|uniref:PaaI family thioesterase n=1 Tax=Helicobacter bizzozeronii TaxID=56877 RepID=UPI000CF0B99B|nr:thioesterase [Helicobacter bizzozeronii]GMT38488.1 PaaI family thioesterase [Helicobacter bizzozeronii]
MADPQMIEEGLLVCTKLDQSLCAELVSFGANKATVCFTPKEFMLCEEDVVHAGFVVSAASFAALCALNKKNSLISSMKISLLAPIEVNQEVYFNATTTHASTKKSSVKVEGEFMEIKVFEGDFEILIFEKRPFKFNFKEDQ